MPSKHVSPAKNRNAHEEEHEDTHDDDEDYEDKDGDEQGHEEQSTDDQVGRERSYQPRHNGVGRRRGDADDDGSPFRGRHYERHHNFIPHSGHKRTPRLSQQAPHWSRDDRRHRSPFRGGEDRLSRLQRGDCRQGRDATGIEDSAGSSRSSSQSSEDDARSRSRSRDMQQRRSQWSQNGDMMDDYDTPRTAMSYRKAPLQQKKNVADRISILVKGTIFKKLKFITSEAMFNKAMTIVVDSEEPSNKDEFVRVYKTCVVGGINSKRSSCEQAGARIVKDLLTTREGLAESIEEPPFAVETIVKLRQATTPLEKAAFLWFIGEFVACVSGSKVWGRKKYYYRVSEAVLDKGSKELVVTVSDEAFAILLYENYIGKWMARYQQLRRGEKPQGKTKGKYTSSVSDHCLYGGWSAEGVARFNELCRIVDNDRTSESATKAEDEVLLALRRRKFGNSIDDLNLMEEPGEETRQPRVMPQVIEAFCEL